MSGSQLSVLVHAAPFKNSAAFILPYTDVQHARFVLFFHMPAVSACRFSRKMCALCGNGRLLRPSELPAKQPRVNGVKLNFRDHKDSLPLTIVSMGAGFTECESEPLLCSECYATHTSMWVRPATGYRARWLHTLPSRLTHILVENMAFDVELLRWFEHLFVCDGTRLANFCEAFLGFHKRTKAHFARQFQHAYVLWASLTWSEQHIVKSHPQWLQHSAEKPGVGNVSASSIYVDCSIGAHGHGIEDFLANVEPYWMADFLDTWLTNHATFCNEACGAFPEKWMKSV